MQAQLSKSPLMTADEAAEVLRVTRRTVHRFGQEGRIEAVHMSPRTVRFRAESVYALIESAIQNGGDQP